MNRIALALLIVLSASSVRAEEDALPDDAPKVVILQNGDYLFNKRAFDATNDEMKRLQGVERQHKAEQWATPVIIGMAVGLLAGIAIAVPVTVVVLKR